MRVKSLVLASAVALLTQCVSLPAALGDTIANNRHDSPAQSKAFAKAYMKSHYGWEGKQYRCLVKLWNRESGWRVHAHNKSSGAHGIPQALPGKKMGPGWKDNAQVQIKWGLKYIKHRYHTPCGALAHSNRKGWY